MARASMNDQFRYWRFTDEVDKMERITMVEELRDLLRYLYAEQLLKSHRLIVKAQCIGCQIDHPSQLQHLCIDPDNDPYARSLYGLAESSLNKSYLKAVFIETANILWLNYKLIDIDRTLQEFLQWWDATDFQDVDRSLNVQESYITAAAAAAFKICSLEKRFTK